MHGLGWAQESMYWMGVQGLQTPHAEAIYRGEGMPDDTLPRDVQMQNG